MDLDLLLNIRQQMQLMREKLDEAQQLCTDFKSITHTTFNHVISVVEQQVDEPEDESPKVEDEMASLEVEDPLVEDFKSIDLFSEPIDFIFPSHYFINELRVVDFISFDLGFDSDFIQARMDVNRFVLILPFYKTRGRVFLNIGGIDAETHSWSDPYPSGYPTKDELDPY